MGEPGTIRTQEPATGEPDRLELLAAQLASLGAETRTERNVKRIVPWFASLAVHLAVIMLALFITWTVTKGPAREESVLIVADFNALTFGQTGSPSQGKSSSDATAASVEAGIDPVQAISPLPLESLIAQRLGETESATLTVDPGLSAASGTIDRFGPAPGSGGAGTASFAGASSSSNARRIVYVIDASGSMVSHLQIVLQELARSLAALSPEQSFAIVFFQKNEAIVVPPGDKLATATVSAKSQAMKWINGNVVPQGGTNPLDAIKQALIFKPDVIFLLSQNITGYGQFEVDQRDLMTLLDQLNPRNPQNDRRLTQINCVQFLDEDPLKTMELITKEHGGPNGFKFLTRRELGLPER